MAKVTAVIPCYNHGQYLDRAVDGIHAQDFEDLEVFIVDDGSTDPETQQILNEFPADSAKVLRKTNGHLSSARNHGIKHATGEYILLCDADDFFAPGFLKKAVPILDEEPKVGAVTCFIELFGVRNERLEIHTGGTITDFLTANRCTPSCLVRKAAWEEAGGFNETMKDGYEDWDFWLSVTEKGWSIHTIPEHLFHKYIARESMVVHSDKMRPELLRRLVQNHSDAYRAHVDQVVYEEENRIEKLRLELDELRGSAAYRVGRCFTDPFGVLGGLLRRVKGD